MSDQWYIKTKNGKRGPYSIAQLQRYIDAGAILPNAGLGSGDGTWVAAIKIDGLVFSDEAVAQLRAALRTKTQQNAAAGGRQSSAPQQTNTESADSSNSGQDDAQRLEAEAGELSERADRLDQRSVDLDRREHDLQERQTTLQERESKLDGREQEFQQELQRQAEREQADFERAAEAEQRAKETEERAKEAEEQLADVLQRADESAKRTEQLESELQENQKTLASLQERLDAQQLEFEDRKRDSERATKELESLQQAVQQQEAKLEDAVASIEEREQGIHQREQDLELRIESLDARENELGEREQRLDERESELSVGEDQVAKLQQEIESLNGSLKAIQLEQEADAARAKDLEARVSELEAELVEAKQEVATERGRVEELQQELDAHSQPVAVDQVTAARESSGETMVATEQLVEEKTRLMSEFAARQDSLSKREADLMQREAELARRESDLTNAAVVAHDRGVELVDVEDTSQEHDVAESDWYASDDDYQATRTDEETVTDSWAEVLGRTQSKPETADIEHFEDPRFASVPGEAESGQSEWEPDETPEGLSGETAPDVADQTSEDQQAASDDVQFKDRLPSELSPTELPEYDRFDPAMEEEESEDRSAIFDFRRNAFEERFGACSQYDTDDDPNMRVDVSIHSPTETRDFTTLVTSGMSDYPIAMPNGQRSVRAELVIYMTHVDELAINILRGAAKIPYRKKQGMTIGTTASLEGLITGTNQTDCVYMLPVIESDSKPIPAKEIVGSTIQLFWMVTITEAERRLIETNGIHKFLSLLEKNNHAVFFDLTRDCYVKRKGWFRR